MPHARQLFSQYARAQTGSPGAGRLRAGTQSDNPAMIITSTLRRRILLGVAAGTCAAAWPLTAASDPWPVWTHFVDRFVQADGRVIDLTFEQKSTSEGQSYGLFLALVANRRDVFDTMLKWTSNNLAAGQLGDNLPAWLWGQRADGSWGVKDANPASDSDLWIAYSLLEAARIWNAPRYAETGRKVLRQIERLDVVSAGAAGAILLPGPFGFALDNGRYRLNPSYLPGFMFRYLTRTDPKGPWQQIWDGYMRMAPQLFRAGVAPDTFVVDSAGKVWPDTEREPLGSYDAIRVYLWAGMTGQNDPDLVRMLGHYAALTRTLGAPPEKVNPVTGVATKGGYSPTGYSGAMLPFLRASGDEPTLAKLRRRVRSSHTSPRAVDSTNYYDQVLILFGQGWIDGHYRFDEDGRLLPRWQR
jgi:endoglucanase